MAIIVDRPIRAVHRVAAADPIPEPEVLARIDAKLRGRLRVVDTARNASRPRVRTDFSTSQAQRRCCVGMVPNVVNVSTR